MARGARPDDLRRRMKADWFVGDGAMATMLHRLGAPIRSCFEALSLTQPELVQGVHEAYVAAGVDWIQTNTFNAHRAGLFRHGLEGQVGEVNRAAVALARAAAGSQAYVFGTIGSANERGVFNLADPAARQTLRDWFAEQLAALLAAGIDGVLLETFADLEEMLVALATVRQLTDLPVIANLSPETIGVTRDGYRIPDALARMRAAGADVVGLNCRLGLAGLLRTYEQMELEPDAVYAAVPNAGMLHYQDGAYAYTASPDYFAEVGVRLARLGVQVLGGCCGTTPEHIRQLVVRIRALGTLDDRGQVAEAPSAGRHSGVLAQAPVAAAVGANERVVVEVGKDAPVAVGALSTGRAEKSLLDGTQQRIRIVVELDPPRTLEVDRYFRGAEALQAAGADFVTLADNSLGTVRISNLAMAALLKQMGIEPLVHVTCRDRNLIGQQSHLMGLHVLGIHHILLVTGDPSRFGDLPGATSVYDVSSIELTRMAKRLNQGIGFSGQPLRTPARFVVGTSFNPHVRHFDKAIDRLRRKLDAGADYVMTQPIFDIRMFERIARAVEEFRVPLFVGVLPLISGRNAWFLHNEVPGIEIPDHILRQMVEASPEVASEVGREIARTLIDEALNHFQGIYLITPFLRYEVTAELTKYIRAKESSALPSAAKVQ